jgi:amino acid adenylation domain-containing protein
MRSHKTIADWQSLPYEASFTAHDAAQYLHSTSGGSTLLVPDQIAEQAKRQKHALALAGPDVSLSYAELDNKANYLAHQLIAAGVTAETPVVVCMNRSPLMLISLLAILRAGGFYIPIDLNYPAKRVHYVIEDSQATVVLTESAIAAHYEFGEHAIFVDTIYFPDTLVAPPDVELRGDQLAYLIYTSGSTGQPKGVEVTHANLAHLACWFINAFTITPADRVSYIVGAAFDVSVIEIWPSLVAGAGLHMTDEMTRISPVNLHDWILAQSITVCFTPTPLAERLLQQDWPANASLRLFITGGDVLRIPPSANIPFTVYNAYGPTECTVITTYGLVDPEPATGLPTIGKPIDRAQVYILNEQLQPVADGESGEIVIGGAGVSRGYRNRPELTAARFISNPMTGDATDRLYRSGDIGYFLPNGEIAFQGRADGQVKIRGYRIELGEIEAALLAQPGIAAGVVIAQPDDDGEKRLVAYIVPVTGTDLSLTQIRVGMGQTLPDYMIPSIFVSLDKLPFTPNGKVDRALLPSPDTANILSEPIVQQEATPLETKVGMLMATVLSMTEIDYDANFFSMGGHSILGTQLLTRVAATFGVTLALRELFQAPTARQLAAVIEQEIIQHVESMSDEEAMHYLALLT